MGGHHLVVEPCDKYQIFFIKVVNLCYANFILVFATFNSFYFTVFIYYWNYFE